MTNVSRLEELKARFLAEPLIVTLESLKMEVLRGGHVTLSFQALPKLCIKEPQILQGGIIAAILDFACVYVAMAHIPIGHTPAKNGTIKFRRPILQNEVVLVIANIEDETRSSILTKGIILGNNGKKKALGFFEFQKPPEPKK